MIKIDFEFDTKYGIYRDALYLSEDHEFSEENIQNMKEIRRDNWIASLETPPLLHVTSDDPNDEIDVNGEKYKKLLSPPPPGAHIITSNGDWYIKV